MKFYLLTLFFCISTKCFGQTAGPLQSAREKIYIHFDKNEYLTGDTIWFKTYIVDGLTQKPSVRSGVYYIELINQQKDFVRRFTYHVVLGTSFGQIPTDTSFFEPGLYKIRAYTRWMQNFGDSLFYEKDIMINDGDIYNKWFLSMSPTVLNGDSVETRMSFTNEAGLPQATQEVAFELFEGKRKAILRNKLQLDAGGGADVKFKLSGEFKREQLRVKVSDPASRRKVYLDIPVNFKKPAIDLQFTPEGGHLVAGLINKIGFKAIDQNGRGVHFNAKVVDSDGQNIASIQPLYKGMGYFSFTPGVGKSYKAVLENGKEVLLPLVEASGVLLKIDKNSTDGKVIIAVEENANTTARYQLIFSSRGYQVHKSAIQLNQGKATITMPQSAFPSGVAIALLYDLKGALISQRQFFVDNKEALQIEVTPSAEGYAKRDSVLLKISAKDMEGRPVVGSFSLAVTDDGQVKKDAETDENILTCLLMQSDLGGNIETPNYYFSNTSDTAQKALDALLLTQGFVRYNWDSSKFALEPEPEYVVSGRVSNIFNKGKGLANYGVSLYTYHRAQFRLKTIADKDGYFQFRKIPQFDTAKFFISAKADTIEYKYGDKIPAKRFKVHIDVDKPVYPSLDAVSFRQFYHPQLNMDNSILNTVRSRNARFISDDPTMMEEVIVKSNAIKGSKNLNGSGNADQVITEAEVRNADGEMDIFEFLKKHVKGYVGPTSLINKEFNRGDDLQNVLPQNFFGSLKGGRNRLYIVIDGQFVDDPFWKANIDFSQLKPKEIRGLELITSPKGTMPYNRAIRNMFDDLTILPSGGRKRGGILPPGDIRGMSDKYFTEYYYLEITTQSGGGIGLVADSRNPGFDQIPTPVFHYGKSSYVPKYTFENKNNPKPDNRSTIYWEPTVVTNEKGEAEVSFYAADNTGTYTILLQGAALNGDLGIYARKIKIVQ